MAGLLDFSTGDNLGDLGLIGGLLSVRMGQGGPAPLIMQAAAMKQAQQKQERENRANDLQQVVATYKILKDQDQEERTNAMFMGKPYTPNPLLAQHEAKLAQLMGTQPMTGGNAPRPQSIPQQPPAPVFEAGQQPPAPSAPVQSPQVAQAPAQSAAPASAPVSLPQMLQGAGIDPRVAAVWAQTPTGKNELFKKLADVYGPRVVNNVLMQYTPEGGTKFLGGVVGKDAMPVVSGPNGLQVQPVAGLDTALAAQAGATTGAQEAAKAPYSFGTYNTGPNGAQQVMSIAKLMGMEGRAPSQAPQPTSSRVASLSVAEPPRPGSGASFGGGLVAPDPVRVNADRAQQEDLSKFHAQTYIETQQAGKTAAQGLQKLDRIDQLLKDVDTGKLTPAGMNVAAYAQSLGIPLDPKLPNKQAAEALTGQIALELRNPAGGAGMPGALSDNDLKFLRSMTPGLAQTTEGRNLIIETKRKLLQRDQEVAQLARQYRQRTGGRVDDGFLEALQGFSNTHPLFPQTQGGGSDIDSLVNQYRSKK